MHLYQKMLNIYMALSQQAILIGNTRKGLDKSGRNRRVNGFRLEDYPYFVTAFSIPAIQSVRLLTLCENGVE